MHKRNSSSTRLLTGFIGISPLRLHYGRAANYGSIIIPCACHRHHRKQSGFRCISFIARSHKEGLGAPTSRLRVSPDTSNVLDECLFNFQCSSENWFVLSLPNGQKNAKIQPLKQKNLRNIENDIYQTVFHHYLDNKKSGH